MVLDAKVCVYACLLVVFLILNVIFILLLPISLTAGVDFSTAGFPRQVTIPAGQTSVQINITVTDDSIVERDERFQVSFTYSDVQPRVIMGFDEATIVIRNDDD